MIGPRLAKKLERFDEVADLLQTKLQKAFASSPWIGNLLDGTWLGAPLHPALTDVPVGASTTAFVLDLGGAVSGSKSLDSAADRALAVAVLGTLPAALTGAGDWRDLQGETRRIATAHALVNSAALALNLGSLVLRACGMRSAGRFASASGLLTTSLAAHVGGELSFGLGVRVNRTAWEERPDRFTTVAEVGEISDQSFHRVELKGAEVLLTRSTAGGLCAIAATCTHLGGPLAEGRRDGDIVTCPWHGSRFDLRTGEVVEGPAVFAQPCYEAREHEGKIQLRLRQLG